jgi:hypothetical protein
MIVFRRVGLVLAVLFLGLMVGVSQSSSVSDLFSGIYSVSPMSVAETAVREFLVGYGNFRGSLIILGICGLLCFIISDIFLRTRRHI